MDEAKHSPEIQWTITMDIAFTQIKEAFERGPVRAFPYFNPGSRSLVVTPELFGNSIGAVLEQRQRGVVRLIGAIGRKMTEDELTYSPMDRVIASLLFACRQWEDTLRHNHFLVNHDVRTWRLVTDQPTELGLKWLKELSAFRFRFNWDY